MFIRNPRRSFVRLYHDDPGTPQAQSPAPTAPAAPAGDDAGAALAAAQAELASLQAAAAAAAADLTARTASLAALEQAMSTDIAGSIASIRDETFRGELQTALQGRPVLDQRQIVALVLRASGLAPAAAPGAPVPPASSQPLAPPPPSGPAPLRPAPAAPDPAMFAKSAAHRLEQLRAAAARAPR